ncbi:MAG: hypothetical protein K0R51_1195 [Cytophagaceae bacterium]|jgi:type III secretory pathway component EscS|nr:hypothetical protein [Cytophagaceae bacterium]
MTNSTITKRTFITTLISVTYLLLTIFYYHIDKYLTGAVFIVLTLLIPATFIAIVVYTIIGLVQVFRERKNLTFKQCLPTIITFTTLTYTLFSPYRLDSERLESNIEIRACYEGTQNQATIKFRQDQSFELNWTGVFGYDKWWTGQWRKKGDTLFLKYDGKKVDQLGEKVIIRNGYLHPIGNSADTIKFRPMFYLGYCRGEN